MVEEVQLLGKEVVSTFDFDQFQANESLDQCGPASVALVHFMGEPGKGAQGTPEQAIALMKQLYSRYIGPDVPSDTGGTSNQTLYSMILDTENHFQNLYPDGGVNGTDTQFGCPQFTLKDTIRKWVEIGYPVIIGVVEDSVYDMGLKKKPYSWNTTGFDHILTVTGVASSGIDLLVRDTANVLAAGPRLYAVTPLKILSATVVIPGVTLWLPRPVSTNPADMFRQPVQGTPTPIPPPAPAPTPVPGETETPAEEVQEVQTLATLQAKIAVLQAQIQDIQTLMAKLPDVVNNATPTSV
jgi:hypothetical protein